MVTDKEYSFAVLADEYKTIADRLRGLLSTLEKKMVFCLICDGRLDNYGEREELIALGYIVGHAAD